MHAYIHAVVCRYRMYVCTCMSFMISVDGLLLQSSGIVRIHPDEHFTLVCLNKQNDVIKWNLLESGHSPAGDTVYTSSLLAWNTSTQDVGFECPGFDICRSASYPLRHCIILMATVMFTSTYKLNSTVIMCLSSVSYNLSDDQVESATLLLKGIQDKQVISHAVWMW